MNTQEQLQQIFSKWSADDLNRLLHLSNGDCGRAINSIIQHERSGLPPEFFLTRDNDTAGRGGEAYPSPPPASSSATAMNNNILIEQLRSGGGRPPCIGSSGGEGTLGLNPSSFRSNMAVYSSHRSSPYVYASSSSAVSLPGTRDVNASSCPSLFDGQVTSYNTERRPQSTCAEAAPPLSRLNEHEEYQTRHPQMDSWYMAGLNQINHQLNNNNNSNRCEGSDIPSVIDVGEELHNNINNNSGPRRGEGEQHVSRKDPFPLPQGERMGAVINGISPEVLLQRLSPEERDRLLLHKLLQDRRQPNVTSRTSLLDDHDIDMAAKELDMLNTQMGILLSHKAQETRKKSSCEENVEDEAIEFGIQQSKKDFQDYCRRQDEVIKMEKQILDEAREASLHEYNTQESDNALLAKEDERVLEEVRRESLATDTQENEDHALLAKEEERVLEQVTRESLATAKQHEDEEDSIIERVKLASLTPPSSIVLEESLVEEALRESLACPPSKEQHLIEDVMRESLNMTTSARSSYNTTSTSRTSYNTANTSRTTFSSLPERMLTDLSSEDLLEDHLSVLSDDDDRKLPARR